jgi:hypothetical protein
MQGVQMKTTKRYKIDIPGNPLCQVLISESDKYEGYFAVSILYSEQGTFTLANGLEKGEAHAINWAEYWLNQKYRGVALLGTAEGEVPSRSSKWTPLV